MNTKRICPGCSKTLASNAPQGLCPECLLKAGLGTGADIGSDTHSASRRIPFVAPSPDELGKLFPQLEMLGFLGQGGMGAVYKARQKELDRVVALKILPPDIGSDPSFAERFTREARALARLNHPNIVVLYEFGCVSAPHGTPAPSEPIQTAAPADPSQPAPGASPPRNLFYFLMEFVDGVNLRQLLKARRVSPREALAVVPQICDALQYAHDEGIVHRDIKPENLLLDRRGRVKVADFGVAKLIGATSDTGAEGATAAASGALTEAGKIMGTPQYMAPEQVEHPGDVDHRADIYALGVVFYQMLTGELPGQPMIPPSRASGKVRVDVRLDEVVLHAMEREPERRYQQASEVKTDVETIANSAPPIPAGKKPLPVLRWRDRWLWERNAAAWGLVLLASLFVLLPFWVQRGSDRAVVMFVAGCIIGLTGVYTWVGYRIRRMKLALPPGEAEIAEGWLAWEHGIWPFNRSQGLAVLHADRLELLPVWYGSAITVPLAEIVSVREVRWVYMPLFWKRGFEMQLANGERVSIAIPEPFARRWRARLSHGELPELPADPMAPASSGADVPGSQRIRAEVKGPAIGLIVAGILNWITIPMMLLVAVYFLGDREGRTGWLILVPLAALVLSSIMLVAGMKMKRLEAYSVAVTGSLLAIVVSPGNVIGLPIGIWALVVLSRREVRDAFGDNQPQARLQSTQSRAGFARKAVTVFATVAILLIAIPVSALLVYLTLSSAQSFPASAIETEIVLNALGSPAGNHFFDVDKSRAVEPPAQYSAWTREQKHEWLRQNGVDLMIKGSALQDWTLLSPVDNAIKLTKVPASWWEDGFSADLTGRQSESSEPLQFVDDGVELLQTQLAGRPTDPDNTFAFQSANGARGLLRISGLALGTGDEVVGLRFRFKKAQPTDANTRRGSQTSSQLLPGIHVTLTANERLENCFFDLDSGRVLSAPPELLESLRASNQLMNGAPPMSAVRGWMRSSGADLMKSKGESGLQQSEGVAGNLAEKVGPHARPQAFDQSSTEYVLQNASAFEQAFAGYVSEVPRHFKLHSEMVSVVKTREGAIALVDILEDNPRSGKIRFRYRLVPSTSPERAMFKPVVEVTLNDMDDLRGGEAVDFDSGVSLDLPNEIEKQSELVRVKWLQDHSVDVLLDQVQGRWGLLTLMSNELKLAPLANDKWDTAIDRDLSQALAAAPSGIEIKQRGTWTIYVLATNSPPPLTFALQTGSSARGLLQITRFGESPNSAQLRYKLVQSGAPFPAGQTR